MDHEKLAATLNRLAFTADLPSHVSAELAAAATMRRFAATEIIFREGSESHVLFVIESGRVALDVHVPGRSDVRMLSLGPGDMLGWSALIGQGQMTTTATALDGVEAVALDARMVLGACDRNPQFGCCIMRQLAVALSKRLVATRLQLLDLFGIPD